jgi:hypothetical protein
MSIRAAFRDGARRVNRAPMILVGVVVVTLMLCLPLALALRGMLRVHLGNSLAAETAASGVNYDWWQEFSEQATGLGATFSPRLIGFGAVLDNLSNLMDNASLPTVLAGAASAYIVVMLFLVGGILDRFARNRPIRSAGFFSACGVYFFRFLRLGLMGLVAYSVLFGWIHPWLFDTIYPKLIRNITVERTAFAWRAILYLLFAALLIAVNVVFDYAKIRAVIEDRRSMIGALAAAGRFVRRNARDVFGLYLLDGLCWLAVIGAYALVAPGAGRTGPTMWMAFAVSEMYVASRIWVKLLFYASQISLFQSRLAHAEYAAAPQPLWPESPAAEAVASPR